MARHGVAVVDHHLPGRIGPVARQAGAREGGQHGDGSGQHHYVKLVCSHCGIPPCLHHCRVNRPGRVCDRSPAVGEVSCRAPPWPGRPSPGAPSLEPPSLASPSLAVSFAGEGDQRLRPPPPPPPPPPALTAVTTVISVTTSFDALTSSSAITSAVHVMVVA